MSNHELSGRARRSAARGWVALAIAACAGCGLGQEGEDGRHVMTVSATDVTDAGWVALDLTDPDLVVYFDHTRGHIDYARISLTCPNGQGMPLDFWLEFEGRRLDRSPQIIGHQMALMAGENPGEEEEATDEEDDCKDCHLCPDGLTICEDLCGSDTGGPGTEEPWRSRSCPWAGCSNPVSDPGAFARDDDPHPDWENLWGASLPDGDDGSGEQDEPRSGAAGGFAGGDGGDDGGEGDDGDDDDDGSSGYADSGGSGWGSGGGSGGGSGSGGGGGGFASSGGNP